MRHNTQAHNDDEELLRISILSCSIMSIIKTANMLDLNDYQRWRAVCVYVCGESRDRDESSTRAPIGCGLKLFRNAGEILNVDWMT